MPTLYRCFHHLTKMLLYPLLGVCLQLVFTTDSTTADGLSESVVVLRGSNRTLTCGLKSLQNQTIQIWFRGFLHGQSDKPVQFLFANGGTSYIPVEYHNVELLETGKLFIYHANDINSGLYNCTPGRSIQLAIEVLPNVTIIGLPSSSLYTSRSYEVGCMATGSSHNVTVTWLKNNQTFDAVQRSTTDVREHGILTQSIMLYRPEPGDTNLTCLVHGQADGSFVYASEEIHNISESVGKLDYQTVGYNESVTLHCEPILNATTFSFWVNPHEFNVELLNGDKTFTISNALFSNENNHYTCLRGNDEVEIISLQVQVIPTLTIKTFENDTDQLLYADEYRTDTLYKVVCEASDVRKPATIGLEINERRMEGIITSSMNRSLLYPDTHEYHIEAYYTPSIGDRVLSCHINSRGKLENESSAIIVTHTIPSHISTEYVKYGGNLSLVLDNFTKGAEGCLKWKFSQRLGYPGVNLPPNVALSNDAKANDSHVTITTATMKNQGFYTCYNWNQQAHVTKIIVNVTTNMLITFDNKPSPADGLVLYRYKSYLITCTMYGTYHPVNISCRVNGTNAADDAGECNIRHHEIYINEMRDDLYDYESTFTYHPQPGDKSLTCVGSSYPDEARSSSSISATARIDDVIYVDAEIIKRYEVLGSDVHMSCSVSNATTDLWWSYHSSHHSTKTYNITTSAEVINTEEINVTIFGVSLENNGKYICHHGLEDVKIILLQVVVDLNILLMPEVDRVYPGTIEAFLISTYTFACTANSTDWIKSITWEINGVPVADGIKTRNESRGQLHQLTSEMTYNPAITDTKISCVVQGINETKEETVFIKLVLPDVTQHLLHAGITVILVIFVVTLILVSCRRKATRTRGNAPSTTRMEMSEVRRRHREEDAVVQAAEWRKSMVVFSNSSRSKFSKMRSSKLFLGKQNDESEGVYARVIGDIYGSNMIPFNQICIVMKLKHGSFLERWIGTFKQNLVKKIGIFLTTVSEAAPIEDQFRWDMFVKTLIDIPNSQYIMTTYGTSLRRGRLYLVQELLEVDSLRACLESQDYHKIENILSYAVQTVEGMSFLTSHEFCHPGISIQKILITAHGRCKLYDFCLREDAQDKIEAIISKKKTHLANLALETLLLDEYSSASDVWSVGVALWEMFSHDGLSMEWTLCVSRLF
ncbi:uncharacterized protein [Apostichopus japonicus]|uniref:uncharacterized protein isoform X2 n=1 Tax=Stichopus japonicus TaxID=307972 RepID=UPI003AB681CF